MTFQLLKIFFVSKLDKSRRLIMYSIAIVSSFMAHGICGLEMVFFHSRIVFYLFAKVQDL